MHRVAPLLALCLALGACASVSSTDLSPELIALDEKAQRYANEGQFSGVVLVAKGGFVLFERAYGVRDAMTGEPSRIGTRYNLASGGKMFTAVAILQQVAAGKASLDDPVRDFLPDYPNPVLGNATLRQLLTHQAGAGDVDELFGIENVENRVSMRSADAIISRLGDRAPVHAPGADQRYGNYGHVILSRIVERLSGLSFEDYVHKNIFAPAGMKQTGFFECDDMLELGAVGYVPDQSEPIVNCRTLPTKGFGAGGQWSTARDMWLFVRALEQGKLLPRALFEEATNTQKNWSGLGFFATDYGKGVPLRDFRWGHGGSADGICTDTRHYPRTGETVITLSNSPAPTCFDVAATLHEAYAANHEVARGE